MTTTNTASTTTNTAINSNSKNGNQDPGLYFIDVARQYSSPVGGETELEPTELNTVKCSGGFLVVSTDKLRVKYTNVNHHDRLRKKRLVYYFEIYVRNAGAKGQIAIGFTNHSFKMRRQPGWEANSCGYHGDDGNLYRGSGTGEAFGPAFTTNDTVGAGINYASQEFFFTKNGAVVGAVYKDIKGLLLPTVAVHSQNEEIEVNFGKKSFAFDLKEYERQEVMKQQMAVDKISLPPIVSYELVRSYLLHNGYEETLKAFDVASKNTIPSIYIAQENGFGEQHIEYALAQRKAVRQLIRNGEIDSALSKLHEWYPQIVQDEKSATCLLLHSQKFIELVRAGALEEAVHYGRIELAKFFKLPGFDDLCSAGYLLEESQREIVADAVNGMILLTDPNVKDAQSCLRSHLERLLRQLTVCCLERRSLNGDQGEGFHLHRALNSTSTAGRGPSANTLV
ncbi:ran-binding protein [Salix suchowensis]|nr:ran-binding protein [Salix suchowensis]